MSVNSEAQFGENLSESGSEGCSESSEASLTRQVKISNHTMIVPSQLPPKLQEATQLYAEQIAVQRKKSLKTCF